MKRSYKKPMVKLVDFSYDEQVVAQSGTWYCFVTVWQGPEDLGICTNPEDWSGDQLYLTKPKA